MNYPIEEFLHCLISNVSDTYYIHFSNKTIIIFVHLNRFNDKKLLNKLDAMTRDLGNFLINK
ncbi:MAG: hypothetical protein IJ848_02235 [Alphaproteobacteria bacterium]|nr:hypothetical protein [Alphaproteobacteria bacterium]